MATARLHRTGAPEIEIAREALPAMPALEREWRALEAQAERGFFLSWAWIGTWLATLPRDVEPFLLRARKAGATAGLAIGVERPARRHFRAAHGIYLNASGDAALDRIFIEHNGFLCPARDEKTMLAALAAWLAQAGEEIDSLHLPGIAAPVAPGRMPEQLHEEPGFTLDLGRDEKLGQQARRALRAYEKHGALAIEEARSVVDALDYFAAMKQFHIASWQRRRRSHAFSEAYFEKFHRALIERAFGEGGIQMLRIACGGAAIGYLYNFRCEGIVSAYQSGFADEDRRLSPGLVSHALAIRFNAGRGERVYDFLAGANRLKEGFASGHYRLYWQVLRRPRLANRLEHAARKLKRRIS